ncbi:hypothetical protein D9613_004411 [Agrocybe pediades]|uniref:Uncharacterized protein n=1 Tax=Agrocybe pediades TaxID=84607 RepID=A0A8H4QLB4_9AGAR|nr:hypothetical protein D9613_004411 [Agrocybe pediades]
MPGLSVTNKSNHSIVVTISNYTNSAKDLAPWAILKVGEVNIFPRDTYEALVIQDPNSEENTRGWYVDCSGAGSENGFLAVIFRGFDQQLGLEGQKTVGFNIRNASGIQGVQAFVSRFNGSGSDSWYNVPTTFGDPANFWARNGREMVAFKDPASGRQKGWYLNTDGGTVNVTFNGFDADLSVSTVGI